MKDNLGKIKKIPLVIDVRRIILKEISKNLTLELLKEAKKKERDIFVYRIVYKSEGHKVIGYIVEPRSAKL